MIFIGMLSSITWKRYKNMNTLKKVDHNALKFNQITIILLTVLAFVLNLAWLAGGVAVVMLLGTLLGVPGFGFIYKYALKPAGLVRPHVLLDNPEPHRFAQGFGGVVLFAGAAVVYLGIPVLGWGLAWVVAALAALNAFGGFCVGCFIYYWLARIHAPGFTKNPPEGTFPGMKPAGSGSESK
jgi:hypothetical protein